MDFVVYPLYRCNLSALALRQYLTVEKRTCRAGTSRRQFSLLKDFKRQVSGYLEYGTDPEHRTVGEVQVLDSVASGLLRVSISVLCFFVT